MEQIVTDDYVAPDLPEDMIISILVHLPVKSLMRFRCVCKDWNNLFQTKSFIAEHLHHSTTKQGYLISDCSMAGCDLRLINPVDDDMNVVEILEQPFIIDAPANTGRLVYSSNGLLCVRLLDSESIFLWNPAIGEFRQVLSTPNRFQEEYYRIGFGFSQILNDHKLVRIYFSWYDTFVHRVEVYSLSKGSWKEVDLGILKGLAEITDHSITWNGAILWFCLKNYVEGSGSDDDADACFILSFDVATEVFALIEIPISNLRSTRYNKLTEYENKLAILSERANGKFNSSSIDLWVMEGLSWSKQYTVTIPFSRSLPPMVIWQDKIICGVTTDKSGTTDDDEEDDSVDDENTKIILVNLMTNELKMSAMRKCCFDDWVFNYVESLVPVSDDSV